MSCTVHSSVYMYTYLTTCVQGYIETQQEWAEERRDYRNSDHKNMHVHVHVALLTFTIASAMTFIPTMKWARLVGCGEIEWDMET